MAKKLYRVTVEVEYVALAESEREARSFAGEAVRNEFIEDCAFASECWKNAHAAQYLDKGELVYHAERHDITVAEALETVGDKPC